MIISLCADQSSNAGWSDGVCSAIQRDQRPSSGSGDSKNEATKLQGRSCIILERRFERFRHPCLRH
jgi:hypothetical protein